MAQNSAVAAPACSMVQRPVMVWARLPEASQPTASMQTSAPSQSVIFLMCRATSLTSRKLMISQLA